MTAKIGIIMGSASDIPVVEKGMPILEELGLEFEVAIASAHRTPADVENYAKGARKRGIRAIIAVAGLSAALPGVVAAATTLPVIGVPIKTSLMGGLDSLLSMVQMPKGIPVACVAVDGADNAAILSAQMLALSDSDLADRLTRFKSDMAQEVAQKDQKMQREEF